jgi:hypothetical protein
MRSCPKELCEEEVDFIASKAFGGDRPWRMLLNADSKSAAEFPLFKLFKNASSFFGFCAEPGFWTPDGSIELLLDLLPPSVLAQLWFDPEVCGCEGDLEFVESASHARTVEENDL